MSLSCHVMIIDDEDWIREGLSEHIDWERLQLTMMGAFKDGEEALRYLEQAPIDLILSDIRMPNMNGLELLRWLRNTASANPKLLRTKVIFLSGYGDFGYAQEALRLGAIDYLLKPADLEEIENALAKAKSIWLKEIELEDKLAALSGDYERYERNSKESIEPTSHLVKRALRLISERYAEELQLSQIAEELFVTPNYLSRLFRQETGLSFSDHLSQIRLKKACEMLVTSPMKIYQVGEAVGYPNSRYFSEWFQKQTGMAPGDYRNRHT
jgi:two-component system response regulator YesN